MSALRDGFIKGVRADKESHDAMGFWVWQRFFGMITAILFSLKFAGLTEISWWRVFLPYAVFLLVTLLILFVSIIIVVSVDSEKKP